MGTWMAHTKGPVIGIIGLGGEASVGCNLSTALCIAADTLGIEGLLLNNGDAQPGEKKHRHVLDHIEGHLLGYIEKTPFEKNVRYASVSDMAKEADITFICYENSGGATHGLTFWEKDPAKKLFADNHETARQLARIFGAQRSTSQIILVTNPSFPLAYVFTKEGVFEPGQVLAFNPEQQRFRSILRKIQQDYGTDRVTDKHLQLACILGDHGSNAHIFLPAVIDHAVLPLPAQIVADVKKQGLDYILRFGNTAKNIVPQLIKFVSDSRRQHPDITYAGMPCPELNNAFCTVPLRSNANKDGHYRAERNNWPIIFAKEHGRNHDFQTTCDRIQDEQETLANGNGKSERSFAAVLDGEASKVRFVGYHGRLPDFTILGQPLAIRTQGNLVAVETQHNISAGLHGAMTRLCDANYLTSTINNNVVYILIKQNGQKTVVSKHGPIPVNPKTEKIAVDGQYIYCADGHGHVTRLYGGLETVISNTTLEKPTDLFVRTPQDVSPYIAVIGEKDGQKLLALHYQNRTARHPATGGAAIGVERASHMPLAFSTEHSTIRAHALGNNGFEQTAEITLGQPILDLAFDDVDNYVYAITQTHLHIIPYWKGQFLGNRKKDEELGKGLEQVEVFRTCQTTIQNS